MWCFSAGQLFAQSLPATNPAAGGAPATSAPATAASEGGGGSAKTGASTVDSGSGGSAKTGASTVDSGSGDRTWARVDYLLWWVKNAPLPVPLVTTGDPNVGFDPNNVNTVNTAGAIGQPGTQVLFGDNSIKFPSFSGMRLTLGGWVEEPEFFGVEGSGFVLERLSHSFAAASDKAGNPPLYFPILSAISGAERAIPIADQLRAFSGIVGVNSNLQLWGADLNGLFYLFGNSSLEVTLLAGFRYANLKENLQIDNATTDLTFNNVTILNDSFGTTNQFYGGQIGGRLAVHRDRFSLDITSKVALGLTHQAVDIQGEITQPGPNPLVPPGLGTFPGGLFAQPSNIGKRSADQFAALPSLELQLGYAITQRTRLFAGYDFMYWSQVVRPGNQIDHSVNLTQNAVLDPNGVGRLVGPAEPAPLFNRSDFWAQGIHFGVEFRY
jgi:hypothetical protein